MHQELLNVNTWFFSFASVVAATLVAIILDQWLHPANLVLIYVLAVVATGLRHGSLPAIAASVCSFLSFNFFLTEPRYTFAVDRQDELATLIFLFLIALVCGPAASQIRRQFTLAKDLQKAQLQAEIEQLRSALLSSVSHDLKSPLSAMMGAAESLALLNEKLSTEDRKTLTETILQESQRLDSYIQNLLDMTRLGYGSLKIERDWVSLGDILGSALTRLRRYFVDVKTEVHFANEVPLLYVHPALIEQAIFNILENAARFTPQSACIKISVECKQQDCFIYIDDQGPGIPQALREKIFDMFYVVADGDKKKQGTGMGLAICRSMIGAHGGSVHVESKNDNSGARFVVRLPINVENAQP